MKGSKWCSLNHVRLNKCAILCKVSCAVKPSIKNEMFTSKFQFDDLKMLGNGEPLNYKYYVMSNRLLFSLAFSIHYYYFVQPTDQLRAENRVNAR